LYNLVNDPYELRNKAIFKPALIASFRTKTEALCSPPPPDFSADFWRTFPA
jgi:hypothetical protein